MFFFFLLEHFALCAFRLLWLEALRLAGGGYGAQVAGFGISPGSRPESEQRNE